MNIGNITSDNFNLDGNGKDIQIEVYEQLIEQLQQENKRLKDNWNKLKEYCKENTLCYEVGDDENTKLIGSRIHGLNVLDKMQEMEKNYGNVEDNT